MAEMFETQVDVTSLNWSNVSGIIVTGLGKRVEWERYLADAQGTGSVGVGAGRLFCAESTTKSFFMDSESHSVDPHSDGGIASFVERRTRR